MGIRVLALTFFLTMALGVWLRWALAGAAELWAPFAYLRHAHSHLGYFGLLFPLAWMGWSAAGVKGLSKTILGLYALSTALSTVGFIVGGYGPLAIAGSTGVAILWLVSAWPLRHRMKAWQDPLGTIPLGLLFSLACVPPVAIHLRTDPELAQGFVSTFLSGLLFLVILPSALGARRISPGPWPLLLVTGALGALSLGAMPGMPWNLGLVAYGGLLLAPVFSKALALHLRGAWLGVAVGLSAMALGLLPNTRPVALGAIHFLILGPLFGTLSPHFLRVKPPEWAWWLGHLCWGTMSGALLAQAFTSAPWTWMLAALGGTATFIWWMLILALQWGKKEPALMGDGLTR